MRFLLSALLLLLLAPWVRASGPAVSVGPVGPAGQEVVERVEVHVTGISGASLYLDHGRDASIEVGDPVWILPLTGSRIPGTIRAVSRTSSRASLDGPVQGLQIGDRGEVLIPAERLAPDPPAPDPPASSPPVQSEPSAPPRPSDEGDPSPTTDTTGTDTTGTDATDGDAFTPTSPPVWTEPPVEWNESTPLLAPVSERKPEDRDLRIHGRAYVGVDATRDAGAGDQDYFAARVGADVTFENPFGHGGELQMDGDLFHRSTDGPSNSLSDGRLRIDRLSYRRGGVRGEPRRWEVGRFLHHEFPELGVIDGAEVIHRTEAGHRVGGSLGFLPEWDDFMSTGDDAAVSLFTRWVSDESEELSLGAAVQKSWHRGEADRDLLVGTADWTPDPSNWMRAAAWVDWYTSGDVNKSSGPELTQLDLHANHRFERGHGLGTFLTHFKWPDTLRNDGFILTPSLVSTTEVTRYGVNGWLDLGDAVRLDGRFSLYTDQVGDGGAADLGVTVRDLFWDQGAARLNVYDFEGGATDGTGLRLAADKRFRSSFFSVSLDLSTLDPGGAAFGPQTNLQQNSLRGTYDLSLGESWGLSLYVDHRFGDQQDARSVGFLLQRRL